MKNKFLNVSLGVTMMLFGTGFLFRSITTANAAPPTPQDFVAEGASKIGKYMISYNCCMDNAGNIYNRAIVMDTETGKSAYYKFNPATDDGWNKSPSQLPEDPIGN